MGFHAYSSPYDWSRIAGFKATAKTVPGGMIDLSVGSPVDPVPSSVQQALVAGADAPNAHGYPVTAGTADLKAAIDTWFRELRGVDLKSINAAAVPTVGSKEAVALMASLLHLKPVSLFGVNGGGQRTQRPEQAKHQLEVLLLQGNRGSLSDCPK